MTDKAKAIKAANNILTAAIFILYPAMIVYLFISRINVAPYILVPGISFVAVSVFRYLYNAPRPYDEPGAPAPILKKDKPGKSFPSRHVFSIFIIGATAFVVWPVVGILVWLAGVVLAWIRVAGGVHYTRDVVAGAVIGLGLGILGYLILL